MSDQGPDIPRRAASGRCPLSQCQFTAPKPPAFPCIGQNTTHGGLVHTHTATVTTVCRKMCSIAVERLLRQPRTLVTEYGLVAGPALGPLPGTEAPADGSRDGENLWQAMRSPAEGTRLQSKSERRLD